MSKSLKVAVIGGGPAGMAAAWAMAKSGAEVTLLERNSYLGGILPQCIHNGFGTQLYEEDMTGGEYEALWEECLKRTDCRIILGATVMSVEPCGAEGRWSVKYVDSSKGSGELVCDSLLVATGCVERSLPKLNIPGSRPAGVFTAGAAQRMMNMKNYLPGRSVVILGSGDVGLIMARRLTLEGVRVKMVLGEKSTGLARNITQCVEDFGIPMRYGWTVAETVGYKRLKGVKIANVATGEAEYVPCDTLLVAAGMVPDRKIFSNCIGKPGVYLCGNADYVHDLVDNVTVNSVRMAVQACEEAGLELSSEVLDLASKELNEQSKGKRGNMVCTVCPKSCDLSVQVCPNMSEAGGEPKYSISGHDCERGRFFAMQELVDPKRVVTTIVKVADIGIVSVRSAKAVSKEEAFEVMKAVQQVVLPTGVSIGYQFFASRTRTSKKYEFVVSGKVVILA